MTGAQKVFYILAATLLSLYARELFVSDLLAAGCIVGAVVVFGLFALLV